MNAINDGIDIIGDCVKLVNEAEKIMSQTHVGYPYVEVSKDARVILSHDALPHVKLWARTVEETTVYVNMDLPGIRRTLKELAESGAPWTEFQAVRYQFVATVDFTAVSSTAVNSTMANPTVVNSITVNSDVANPTMPEPIIPDWVNFDDFSLDGTFEENVTQK